MTTPNPAQAVRKIVQIAIAQEECVHALCDDGTVWFLGYENRKPEWTQLPAIPQPENDDGE